MPRYILCICLLILLTAAHTASADRITVKSNELGTLSLDGVGVATPSSVGLPSNIWHTTTRAHAAFLITSLPDSPKTTALRTLQKNLLSATIAPPSSSNATPVDFFSLRLKKLALMGEYETVKAMIHAVPENRRTEEMQRILTGAMLKANQFDEACTLIQQHVSTYTSFDWRQWLILCQHFQGQTAAAKLGMKVIKNNGYAFSDAFLAMAEGLADKGEKKDEATQQWIFFVTKDTLALQKLEAPFPKQQWADSSADLNTTLKKQWQAALSIEGNAKRAYEAITLYNLAYSVGANISHEHWQEAVQYALYHGRPAIFSRLTIALKHMVKEQHYAETILLSILVLYHTEPTAATTIADTLLALTEAGFASHARAIAAEILTAE